jgi:hypothetical protein
MDPARSRWWIYDPNQIEVRDRSLEGAEGREVPGRGLARRERPGTGCAQREAVRWIGNSQTGIVTAYFSPQQD